SRILNASRYAKALLASIDMPFEQRYRSYIGVFGVDEAKRYLVDAPVVRHDALELAFEASPSEDALSRMFAVDAPTQLPDDLLALTDKMTMATSLECRVPLLDHELVELAAKIPSSV